MIHNDKLIFEQVNPKRRPPIRISKMPTKEIMENTLNYRKCVQHNIRRTIEERHRHLVTSTDDEESDIDNSLYAKYSSEDDKQDTDTSYYNSEISLEQKYLIHKQSSKKYNFNSVHKRRNLLYKIFAIALFIFICILYAFSTSLKEVITQWHEKEHITPRKLDSTLKQYMKNIKSKFCNQKPDIWSDIFSGMYNIISYPKKPFIITLFSNETKTMNCLAQALGEISGTVLGTDSYLTLMPTDFANDVGEVIYTLKPKIIQKRAVIVHDLLKINMDAIKAFHNFCDRECPLVENTIYIITIAIDKYDTTMSEIEFIEREIGRIFSKDIQGDILNPLTTRILDGAVIHVQTCLDIDNCVLKAH